MIVNLTRRTSRIDVDGNIERGANDGFDLRYRVGRTLHTIGNRSAVVAATSRGREHIVAADAAAFDEVVITEGTRILCRRRTDHARC